METKHTPGPWTLPVGVMSASNVWDSSGSVQIASFIDAPGRGLHRENEAEANARLIAAAPDMLEALELAESFMAGFEGDEMQEGVDARLNTIRAAIAKAKGGAA